MAGAVCTVQCETDELVQVVNQCQDADNLIEFKADRFAFIKCESVVTSLTDDTEWAALKADTKIVTTPQLIEFEIPEPEKTTLKTKDCQTSESVIGKTQTLPIDSILLDVATKTDEDFVADFYKNVEGYAVILGACGNTIYYNKSWTTGTNPGWGGIVGDLNYVTKTVGNKKYLAIKGNIQFDITGQGWARLTVTKAVYDAIFN